jgi:hypothetical protein
MPKIRKKKKIDLGVLNRAFLTFLTAYSQKMRKRTPNRRFLGRCCYALVQINASDINRVSGEHCGQKLGRERPVFRSHPNFLGGGGHWEPRRSGRSKAAEPTSTPVPIYGIKTIECMMLFSECKFWGRKFDKR